MQKIFAVVLTLLAALFAVAQTGGGFSLEQNVIGSGGWRSEGGGFTVLGTMGQANAGSTAVGGRFHLIDGLWAVENPTAVSPFAAVSGRVFRAGGVGIPRVLITLTNQTTAHTYETWTRAQGYYEFPEVPAGAHYAVAISHRHFQFEPGSILIFVSQDRSDVDFVSLQ